MRDLRQNWLDLPQILTTHSLSDCCGPLLATPTGTLANSPAKPVIRDQARFGARALGRQTAIRAELFRAILALFERLGTQNEAAANRQKAVRWNFLKPLRRGGEDCDAKSAYVTKPRKSRGFTHRAEHCSAPGRALGR